MNKEILEMAIKYEMDHGNDNEYITILQGKLDKLNNIKPKKPFDVNLSIKL